MRQTFLLTGVAALAAISITLSSAPAHSQTTLQRVWQRSLNANADSAPAYLPHVRSPGGRARPVVYVLTGNNGSNCDSGDPVSRSVLDAFDARNGARLWSRATRGGQRCTTAGPVVDPSGRWVYAPGFDGRVHRYDAATGREPAGNGWPHQVTLMPSVEKIAATPTIGTHYLYVTTSGFIGDQGHYQGHLVTIDLRNGRARIFNSLCSNIHGLLGPRSGASNYCPFERSGFFGRGQGAVDPVNHDVYIVSGNGRWNGRTNWGDSLLKLNPSGSRLIDAFTPTNQASLEASDADLGSTGPAILPAVREGGQAYHLLVQGGKGPACEVCSGVALRLLNRDNLSGRGGPGHLGGDLQDAQAPCGQEVLTAPAVWKSTQGVRVFYANDCGIASYRLSFGGGHFQLTKVWQVGPGGSTPVLARGTLWVTHDGELSGYAPLTGRKLYSASIGSIHWEYPLIRKGRAFITDEDGHLSAFRLP